MVKHLVLSLAALMLLAADVSPVDLPSAKRAEAFFEAHGYDMDKAVTEAICRRVKDLEPPGSDRPTAAETRSLKGCDSESLYYGIGAPSDPVKARKCAFIEGNPNDQPLALHNEEGMLMMIYANGRGVSRNMELAIHYACQIHDSAAARDFRVRDLDDRAKTGWRGSDFESCEHITSGLAQGYCAGHGYLLADQARHHRMETISRSWTRPQRALFDRAFKSAEEYARTLHEMDCFRGTAQAACTIGAANEFMEDFIRRIVGVARGEAAELEARTDVERRKIAFEAAEAKATNNDDWLGDDRKWYEENERETAAMRVKFERDLVAFARATFPSVTSHRIRRIFADM